MSTDREAAGYRYQPCYCEENVWWLCQHPRLRELERWAVFVSNATQRCPLWRQRAVPAEGVAIWDYHVILVAGADDAHRVWDLDSRLPLPTPALQYFAETFPLAGHVPGLEPLFRVVAAAELLATFTTDRHHMRDGGGDFTRPPPSWLPPTAPDHAHNLDRFLDMQSPFIGEVLALDAMRQRFGAR